MGFPAIYYLGLCLSVAAAPTSRSKSIGRVVDIVESVDLGAAFAVIVFRNS